MFTESQIKFYLITVKGPNSKETNPHPKHRSTHYMMYSELSLTLHHMYVHMYIICSSDNVTAFKIYFLCSDALVCRNWYHLMSWRITRCVYMNRTL